MVRRVRPGAGLGSLVGSDSEPDLGGVVAESFARKKMSAMKKAPANKVVKPAHKLAGHGERRTARPDSPPRQALADRSNLKSSRSLKMTGKEHKLTSVADDDLSLDDSSDAAPYKPRKIHREHAESREPKRQVKSSSMDNAGENATSMRKKGRDYLQEEIPETQLADNVDMVDVFDDEDPVSEAESQPVEPAVTKSKPAEVDTENATLKRRLREMTEKYESLEERHRELWEVGVKAAERNYDKLRKQTDENSATASKLIAELKKEVESQQKAARGTEELRRQLAQSEANVKNLQSDLASMTQSQVEADREITTLKAKLAASRSTEATLKAPGSALKGSWTGQSELMHAAQAKVDLYGDLTGLLVQSVKRDGPEDVFDCLQTGRNGTLHFKLALASGSESGRYEDMEITYRPQLQQDRDGDLMDLLPHYLLEEIQFRRSQAANFFSRVIRALTEKRDRYS